MPSRTTYTLSELTRFIRRVFALNLPEAVWVTAELGQVNKSRGHYWLTLVEKGEQDTVAAQLEGVIWASQLQVLQRNYGIKMLRDLLQDGMSVKLKVITSFHPRYGLKVVVEDVDPSFTMGELERKRKAVLEQLANEGLLRKNASLPFPVLPQSLAVISSETAAGLADFRQQLAQNPYGYRFRVRLFSAAMQGGNTTSEILTRLRQINHQGESFDAVVIIRGGGGRTDLAAFDEPSLCRAVAGYPLPVIVGIGHETDESVLDQVAARSCKTPTATATFLIEQLVAAEYNVLQLGRGIVQHSQHHLHAANLQLSPIRAQVHQLAQNKVLTAGAKLAQLSKDLRTAEENALASRRDQLNHLAELLTALRPEATLARGYALASQQGKLLIDPSSVKSGEVTLRLRDGSITLRKED